jgi:hypothetical protein
MSRKQRRAATQQQNRNRPQNSSTYGGGPRTPEGKAVSAQNAFSHGLTAARLVLPWENQDEFDSLLNQLVAEHKPATATEGILVREIAEQYWRLQRARNHEHGLLSQTPEVLEQAESDPDVYEVWNKQVTLAQRYVTRHERAFHKSLATVRTLQKERRLAEAEAEAQTESIAPSAQFVSQNPEVPAKSASKPNLDTEPGSVSDPKTGFALQKEVATAA